MIEFRTEKYREDLVLKRMISLNISMGEAAKQIGISKATYSRIESGKLPDIETYMKTLNWLNKQGSEYINSGIITRGK